PASRTPAAARGSASASAGAASAASTPGQTPGPPPSSPLRRPGSFAPTVHPAAPPSQGFFPPTRRSARSQNGQSTASSGPAGTTQQGAGSPWGPGFASNGTPLANGGAYANGGGGGPPTGEVSLARRPDQGWIDMGKTRGGG